MKTFDLVKPAVKLIEKKVKDLVASDQVALFVTAGHGTPLAFAGDSAITAWFMEKHGFEFKQKVAELLRTGNNGIFTKSLDKEADQTRLKNICHLPLLEFHIDDPKFMNTKVVKSIYSKMAAAEGLSRSVGVEGKIPPWWVD